MNAHVVAGALCAMAFNGHLRAQVADEPSRAIETIRVVGSHIGDPGLVDRSPVLTLSREAIERSAAFSVGEVLQRLPVDNAGSFNDRDALSAALGGASVSLRGMGAASTLVLINGRRATGYPLAHRDALGGGVSFVDLNGVPLAAVERIEVLKDGASAVYGSDATAGVVNIVLRDDLVGTGLELRRGAASGADERALSIASGWSALRTNVAVLATYSDREQLAWRSRDVSASADRAALGGADLRSLAAANFRVDGVGNFDADCEERNGENGAPAFRELTDYGICVFDPNSEIVVPSARRAGVTTIVSHELGPALQLRVEASYLRSEARGKRDPVAWSSGPFPAANPWNPFGRDVLAEYRFSELGPRLDSVEADNRRLVVELAGDVRGWQWTYTALQHETDADNRGEGYLNGDRVTRALAGVDQDADGFLAQDEYLNLFSPATHPTSAALLNSLAVATLRQSTSALQSQMFRVSRRLLERRAGDVLGAFGIEQLRETLDDESDPLSVGSLLAAQSAFRGWFGMRVDLPFAEIDPYAYVFPWDVPHGPLEPMGFPPSRGSRGRKGLFGELHVPLLPKLHLQAALRHEALAAYGSKIAPRLAISYAGLSRARISASWGQGFRAPSLVETNLGPSSKLQASWDPQRCPEPGLLIPERAGGCAIRSFVATTMGNPTLGAERSESWTMGIDIRLAERGSLALDCWRTELRDKIMWAQTAWMIRNEHRLPPGLVQRDPLGDETVVGSRDAYPGTIAAINLVPLNYGWQRAHGCDVEISSTWGGGSAGTFDAQFLGTHMASNRLAFGAADAGEELTGTYGYPQRRATLNLVWSRHVWEVGLYGRWTDGFDDTLPGHRVAGRAEWDTRFSYLGPRSMRWTFGVENLFDRPPPSAFGEGFLQGFPVALYDMRGRFVYAEARLGIGAGSASRTVSR